MRPLRTDDEKAEWEGWAEVESEPASLEGFQIFRPRNPSLARAGI